VCFGVVFRFSMCLLGACQRRAPKEQAGLVPSQHPGCACRLRCVFAHQRDVMCVERPASARRDAARQGLRCDAHRLLYLPAASCTCKGASSEKQFGLHAAVLRFACWQPPLQATLVHRDACRARIRQSAGHLLRWRRWRPRAWLSAGDHTTGIHRIHVWPSATSASACSSQLRDGSTGRNLYQLPSSPVAWRQYSRLRIDGLHH
jgi:hypothetical protein